MMHVPQGTEAFDYRRGELPCRTSFAPICCVWGPSDESLANILRHGGLVLLERKPTVFCIEVVIVTRGGGVSNLTQENAPRSKKRDVQNSTKKMRRSVCDSQSRLCPSPQAEVFLAPPCTISSFFLRRASACSPRAERSLAALAALLGVVVHILLVELPIFMVSPPTLPQFLLPHPPPPYSPSFCRQTLQ